MVVYEKIFQLYGLSATQKKIIELVGKKQKVLEIGPSSGYMTKFFINNGCTVDVIEINKQAIKKIPRGVNKIINKSVEDPVTIADLDSRYDFIVMSDVLEHLINPEMALKNLRLIADQSTKLIISTPNVACWAIRKNLFFKGEFEYQDSGILDKTHLHFYTTGSLPKFLKKNGWQIEQMIGTIIRVPLEGLVSKVPILNYIFSNLIKNHLANHFKNLCYVHFITIANYE